MKIVSWHNTLTEHQYHTLLELEGCIGNPIEYVVGKKEIPIRKKQGWRAPDTVDLKICELSSCWWKQGKKIIDFNQDSIHIFNGLWTDRRLFPLLLYAQFKGIKTALVTEPYSDFNAGYFNDQSVFVGWMKVMIRPFLYRLAGIITSKKMGMVFAVSDKAEEQFIRAGFKRDSIFPFGYFVPKISSDNRPKHTRIKIFAIFVGSIIERKGVDIAINAIKKCRLDGFDIQLDIFGIIENKDILGGMPAGVKYKGVIPFGDTQCVMAGYDLFILPSRYDGWGVVVNEAILQAVPVLVSSQVGAKKIVEESGAGKVFNDGDVDSLYNYLKEIVINASVLEGWKKCAKEYQLLISPEVAARYMYRCLCFVFYNEGGRPTCFLDAKQENKF